MKRTHLVALLPLVVACGGGGEVNNDESDLWSGRNSTVAGAGGSVAGAGGSIAGAAGNGGSIAGAAGSGGSIAGAAGSGGSIAGAAGSGGSFAGAGGSIAGAAGSGGSIAGAGGSVDQGGSAGSVDQGGAGGAVDQGGSAGSVDQGGSAGSVDQGGSGGSVDQGGSAGSVDQGGAGGAVASCVDGLTNGGETDRDCGGPTACPRCPNTFHCAQSSDCQSTRCDEGVCAPLITFADTGATVTGSAGLQRFVLTDVTGDGHPDVVGLIVATGSSLATFANDGAGNFATFGALTPANDGAVDLAVGLIDGDAIPDAAVVLQNSHTVGIFYGKGDGTFVTGPTYAAGTPFRVALDDLNGDGHLDVAVTDGGLGDHALYLYKNDGTGQLTAFAGSPITVDDAQPDPIVAADFDGDAHRDLAIGYRAGGVQILSGDGLGGFTPKTTIDGGFSPISIAVFGPATARNLVIAPQNGNEGEGGLFVYDNDGTGAFTDVVPQQPTIGFVNVVAAADLDGDGRVDFYYGAQSGFGTLEDDGAQGLAYRFGSTAARTHVAFADIVGDPLPDVVYSDATGLHLGPNVTNQ